MKNPTVTGAISSVTRVYRSDITIATYDILTDVPAYVATILNDIKVALGIPEVGGAVTAAEQLSMTLKGIVRYYIVRVTLSF